MGQPGKYFSFQKNYNILPKFPKNTKIYIMKYKNKNYSLRLEKFLNWVDEEVECKDKKHWIRPIFNS